MAFFSYESLAWKERGGAQAEPPPAQRLGGRPWQTEPQNGELGWLVGLLECGRALRGVKVSK